MLMTIYRNNVHWFIQVSKMANTADHVTLGIYMIFQLYHGSQVYWRKKTTDGE
jgi:hypothetical protein